MATGQVYPVGYRQEEGDSEFDYEMAMVMGAGGVAVASLLWKSVGALLRCAKRKILMGWTKEAMLGSGSFVYFSISLGLKSH